MNAPASSVDPWAIVLTVVLGFAAVYLLLPRVRRFPRWLGGAAAAAAVLSAGWLIVRAQFVSAEVLLFYAFAFAAVVSGGMLVLQRNPVHGALSFALVVLATCGLFLLQAAPFLMAATTIVYAGAIVVTFLFVIMLAQQEGPSDADQHAQEPFLSTLAATVLFGAILVVINMTLDLRELGALGEQAKRAAAA